VPRAFKIVLKVVGILGLVLVLLLVAAGGYVAWSLRRSLPQTAGTLKVSGLTAPVDVYRDKFGVPQLYADTTADLFFAQGYVSAQDRFWEMDFRRHVTAGRLSEMFGASQLDTDKFLRISGWRRVAEEEYPLLAPETRAMLQVYAKGVNAYLATHSGAKLSFEYVVLGLEHSGYKVEPWTPIDSLAWLKAMAWDLKGNYDEEIARAIAAAKVGVAAAEELFPAYPYARNRTIVDQGAVVNGKFDQNAAATTGASAGQGAYRQDAGQAQPLAINALYRASTALHVLDPVLGAQTGGVGSNSWVVSGSKTLTGKPMLANDPHLGPVMPSIWYQMGLHCRTLSRACPFDVSGYTFSGLPGVVIGHNNKIAWGFTNLGPDVLDLYLEKVVPGGYQVDGKAVPFVEHTETIKVAGAKDVLITVRATKDGPLISDAGVDVIGELGKVSPVPGQAPKRGSGYAVALKWTALQPTRTADAIALLDQAQNWNDFRAAAASFAVPSQNLIYADTSGNIGYQSPGLIPIRQGYDGRYPVAGWESRNKWIGYLPFAALPSVENPKDGFIVTANNAVVPPSYPYYLTSDWTYGSRSQRVTELVVAATSGGSLMTTDKMRSIELDTANSNASILAPALLAAPVSGSTAAAQTLMRGWDYNQPANSAAAAFFNATYAHLLQRLFAGVYTGDQRPDGHDRWFEVVRKLLANRSDFWWQRAEKQLHVGDSNAVLAIAMRDASAELTKRLGSDPTKWQWGALHTLTVANASFGTSGIGPIEWLFNSDSIQLPSGSDSVDATGWSARNGYQVDEVPSMRMVVDLSNLDHSSWINLTGASGHTFSAHYTDQLPLWASGRATPFAFTSSAVKVAAVDHLVLQPA
jgi:penicillin amidase